MRLRLVWQSGLFELFDSLRSRRALVVLVIYLAASLLGMNGTISALGKIESQLAGVLAVETPADGRSGVISKTLWQSDHFKRMVRRSVGNSLVYDDICGKHPAELLYAWLAFMFVPLFTILVASNRIADDVRSGAVRYMLTRVTRLEWTLGKFFGNALLLAAGILLGSVAAWCVAAFRLAGADIVMLFPGMLAWGLKAWAYSLAWLGLALGVSHIARSGTRATSIGVFALVAWSAASASLAHFGERFSVLARLFPSSVENMLWRSSFAPVACGTAWLLLLGLLYLSFGYSLFSRRDVR